MTATLACPSCGKTEGLHMLITLEVPAWKNVTKAEVAHGGARTLEFGPAMADGSASSLVREAERDDVGFGVQKDVLACSECGWEGALDGSSLVTKRRGPAGEALADDGTPLYVGELPGQESLL